MGEIRRVTEYLHKSREELSDLWDFEAPQQDVFHYVLYELEVDLDVDMETGRAVIVSVNGAPLMAPVPA